MDSVKVLLIGPVPPPQGGIAFYVRSLLNSRMDHVEFDLFNTSIPSWVAPLSRVGRMTYSSIFGSGIWVAIKMVGYVAFSYLLLFGKLLESPPDIVHVFPSSYWGYWRHWLYLLISKLIAHQSIFHLLNAIDVFYSNVGSLQKHLIELSLNSADIYLLQSVGLEEWVKQYSQKEVIGFLNGINFDQIPAVDGVVPAFHNRDAPVGITVGQLGTRKGTYDILESLVSLKAKGEIVNWIFIGGGDIEGFERLADELGIQEQVALTGTVDETTKWQYLKGADFYSLPSYAEGQPISIIEAMAVGLPIVSSAVGSIPEIIGNGVNGFVIQPGDQVELTQSIRKLVSDPAIRQQMREESLRCARERHDIQRLYKKLADIYISLGNR